MCKGTYISLSYISVSLFLSLSPMAVNSCEELVTLSHSEVSNQLNNRMCLDSKLNCQTYIEQEIVNTDAVSPCIVDIYVEKGHSGMPKASETGEKLKIEGPFTDLKRGLQKQISLQIGERLMQLLMNGSIGLPKFISREKSATERVHETPNSRTRKYKRSASFNSRKVALLFSVLARSFISSAYSPFQINRRNHGADMFDTESETYKRRFCSHLISSSSTCLQCLIILF
ncbi:hypothetical protein RHGRI_022383 [Rhododendron griersonianum]|uniref:Uncharacterized protein n=1 Tax=Rhododendron griersonianum TaxID=479676 RepID=A0AAV6J3S6_9ERIC|nr:hypothetical protein RHGRI_022383 [Rhododendron griersonianum]